MILLKVPLVGVNNMILGITSFFSAFIFKERMFWWQWIGVVVGGNNEAIQKYIQNQLKEDMINEKISIKLIFYKGLKQ